MRENGKTRELLSIENLDGIRTKTFSVTRKSSKSLYEILELPTKHIVFSNHIMYYYHGFSHS